MRGAPAYGNDRFPKIRGSDDLPHLRIPRNCGLRFCQPVAVLFYIYFGKLFGKHGLEYSSSVAQALLEALNLSLPKWKYVSFRRSLALVDDAARNESVRNGVFSYDRRVGKRRARECFGPLLDAYLEQRWQNGNQSSALHMDRNGICFMLQ
jgi:hypothetical protein